MVPGTQPRHCHLGSTATAIAQGRAEQTRQREAEANDANSLNERLLITVLDGGGG